MVNRDLLLSMNMKKGGGSKCHIFNPCIKHLKCHGFINYLTLSTMHHGKYFYYVIYKKTLPLTPNCRIPPCVTCAIPISPINVILEKFCLMYE